MNIKSLPRLRQDIKINKTWKSDTQTQAYLIENPNSGEYFEIGEPEYFLCQSLDSGLTAEVIITRFREQFGISLTLNDLDEFIKKITDIGLIEYDQDQLLSQEDIDDDDYDDDLLLFASDLESKDWKHNFKSEKLFNLAASPFRSIGIPLKYFVWGLLPFTMIAIGIWIKYWPMLFSERGLVKSEIGFLGSFMVFLVAENLLGKFMKGIIATCYGASVTDFSTHLRWYFLPRFHIRIAGLRNLSREQQMWVQGGPLLNRAIIFICGTFITFFNLGKQTTLASWGMVFAALGMLTFLHDAFPLRYRSAGNKITCLYFNKSARYTRQVIKRSLKFFASLWSRNSRGNVSISITEIGLIVLCLTIVVIEIYIAWEVVDRFALGLSRTFPEILGLGTYPILLVILGILAGKYMTKRVFKSFVASPIPANAPESALKQNKFFNFRTILLFTFVVILCLPVNYAPGGIIQLLPPKQQPIQAPISGQIIKIFFQGGDGQLIREGTVVATIVSLDLQHDILDLQQEITKQQADLEQQQVNLEKLIAGSTQEEIDIARKEVDLAQQQVAAARGQVNVVREEVEGAKAQVKASSKDVEIARKQIESAMVDYKYSEAEVLREQKLYQEGAFSLQQLENAKKTAMIDKITIEQSRENLAEKESNLKEIEQNLAAKVKALEEEQQNVETSQKNLDKSEAQLRLVLSGSRSEDIEAARKLVKISETDLKRLQASLKYEMDRNKSANLLMPFDGYLVESYLSKKLGSFINQGDTFATAEDLEKLLVELELPEYETAEITVGDPAELRLLAYPNQPISGQVLSIEPASTSLPPTGDTSTTTASYRFFRVLIEPIDAKEALKPGMSGYGKVKTGKKPLIVALTRPLIRFIQVEFWSWLP